MVVWMVWEVQERIVEVSWVRVQIAPLFVVWSMSSNFCNKIVVEEAFLWNVWIIISPYISNGIAIKNEDGMGGIGENKERRSNEEK